MKWTCTSSASYTNTATDKKFHAKRIKVAFLQIMAPIDSRHVSWDFDVLYSFKNDLELSKHAGLLLKSTQVPLQDFLEGLVFVSFCYALDGRGLLTSPWLRDVLIVAIGLTATDILAPAMAQPMRLSVALIFYSKPV